MGSGQIPESANTLFVSTSAGISSGMVVTDGGVNLTGNPLVVTGTCTGTAPATCPVGNNYYPTFTTPVSMVAAWSTLIPGQYLSFVNSRVKILDYQGACGQTGAYNGGPGCYTVYNPLSLSISPRTTITTTGITDGGAVAPGRALTIRDQGPGVIFPVTNYSAGTGTLDLSGTFDTSLLGGTPTVIQAQISYTAGGPPVPGCSACAWTNLTGYAATPDSGTVFNWKGQAVNIPGKQGPLYISVRAANGTAYATMPNFVNIGLAFETYGEGQLGAWPGGGASGTIWSSGLWAFNSWSIGNIGPSTASGLLPGQTTPNIGDRFNIIGFPDGPGILNQKLTNALGVPSMEIDTIRDGIGIGNEILGNVVQRQMVGVGDGTTTVWCSTTNFCAVPSVSGQLVFNAATMTGASFSGSVSGSVVTIGSLSAASPGTWGAIQPGEVLSGAGISGSPTLLYCLTGCAASSGGSGSTWMLSASLGTIGTEPMRADPPGGAPWPLFRAAGNGNSSLSQALIQAGTFKITQLLSGVTTTLCQDTTAFAYNNENGNCTGANVSSSFVNYLTGDYSVTFTTAPASGAVLSASWTNIQSPEALTSLNTQRPFPVDWFGTGPATSGPISSAFGRSPSGISGHIMAGPISDNFCYRLSVNTTYPYCAVGYSQAISWLYNTRFQTIPGQNLSPLMSGYDWRQEGPTTLTTGVNTDGASTEQFIQWSQDLIRKSTFSGTIASSTATAGVLTLTAPAVGDMWEGEIVGCNPFSLSCAIPQGTFITGLASGAWGASGSTYNLSNPNSTAAFPIASPTTMTNAVYYTGSTPPVYMGTENDTLVQPGSGGPSFHLTAGSFASAARASRRWAALAWGALANGASAQVPMLDRVKADATGCDAAAIASPCFDIGNTFAARHSGTITGSQIVVTGGLAAHDRPFVVGQLLTCSGCATGHFITSISVPPTQSTQAGAGEVGQTFTITADGSLLAGPTTETVTAGCSGTSGTGSNCIDVAFSINTTGTYGTAASLATCGEDNLNGNAPNNQPPRGVCQTNGVGSLVRDFRIGTNQHMWSIVPPATAPTPGSPYDDGRDIGGQFNQSAAFTCNIVAAKVVQCVKGAAYGQTTHLLIGIGSWASGSTYIEYGDAVVGTGFNSAALGNVGGQPLPFTPGSGYTNGVTRVQGNTTTCHQISTPYITPAIDITVSGGSIVNTYWSAAGATSAQGLSNGGSCTFDLTSLGGIGGSIGTMPLTPFDGSFGIATYSSDNNMIGDLLYDNSGLPGNPLSQFFTCQAGSGYCEPGLPVMPWGGFMAAAVSG